MDDVYISDPRQTSAQAIAQKQKDKKNSLKRRNFRQYLFDIIVKTLICSCLIAIDFTLFAEAGSYNLFDINNIPTLEVQYILGGITAICFIVMLLLSFSAFIQNLMIALSFGALVLSIFNQFALFDQNSILYNLFNNYLDSGISDVFINHSDWIIAGFVAVISLILISYTSRINQIYLLGTLLLVLGGIISEAYFNPVTRNFDSKKSLQGLSAQKDGKTFIFLALPNFASYTDIKDAQSKNYTVNQVADNILGFYELNKFVHYPNAYVTPYDNEFMNLVATLNPQKQEKPEENLLNNVMLTSFWDFKNLDTDKLYLKNNDLYKHFFKQDYNIRTFQTRGIELCTVNNDLSVSKCMEKINHPISLNRPGLSTADKTILLTAQWLVSTKIVSDINLPLRALSYLSSKIAPLNFSAAELYPVNSFKIFDLIIDDLKAARGNNAYFAVIDLPSSTYVYNDFCDLKSPYQWLGTQQQPWSKGGSFNAKQQAYAEQTNCLIGQLEHFIQELEKNGRLAETTIVLQGLGPTKQFPGKNEMLKEFSRVGLAILKPEQKQAQTRYDLCPAASIINTHLGGEPCQELAEENTTDKRKEKILNEAHKNIITEQHLRSVVNRFKNWYQTFASHNLYENSLNEENKKTEPAAEQKETSIEIKKVKVTKVAEELPAETKMESISAAMQKTEKAAADTTAKTDEQKDGVKPKENKDSSQEDLKSDKTAPTVEEPKAKQTEAPVAETENAPQETEKQKAESVKQTPETDQVKQQSKTIAPKTEPKSQTAAQTAPAKPDPKKETAAQPVEQEIPLTKPERLKREYRAKQQAAQTAKNDAAQVKIEVQLTDKTEKALDVIPPALLGETKYKPAETDE